MAETKVKISGMSCEHCVRRVTKALEGLPGVKNVRVDLTSGTATFEKPEDLSLSEIARAIEEAGYRVEGA
ncbi:heavy-metal-associated domain-containing protein [Thermosulfurimonas marina]|uniref:Heavy-metal-associated domain-containing protein n=1 Tax=Thermosulfurimonas marina TaxID=2047767 RepID=A0A6H1WQD7_9BACT|nr:heavy metal-associated domain-containing protein [Thermosulfurimonas marina]QJA05393.1 heavy-metal-associated domain-containing protein [Thermosulfurimonas marina]